jgi:hypothetical protein
MRRLHAVQLASLSNSRIEHRWQGIPFVSGPYSGLPLGLSAIAIADVIATAVTTKAPFSHAFSA